MSVQTWKLVGKETVGQLVCFGCSRWVTGEKCKWKGPIEEIAERRKCVASGIELKAKEASDELWNMSTNSRGSKDDELTCVP